MQYYSSSPNFYCMNSYISRWSSRSTWSSDSSALAGRRLGGEREWQWRCEWERWDASHAGMGPNFVYEYSDLEMYSLESCIRYEYIVDSLESCIHYEYIALRPACACVRSARSRSRTTRGCSRCSPRRWHTPGASTATASAHTHSHTWCFLWAYCMLQLQLQLLSCCSAARCWWTWCRSASAMRSTSARSSSPSPTPSRAAARGATRCGRSDGSAHSTPSTSSACMARSRSPFSDLLLIFHSHSGASNTLIGNTHSVVVLLSISSSYCKSYKNTVHTFYFSGLLCTVFYSYSSFSLEYSLLLVILIRKDADFWVLMLPRIVFLSYFTLVYMLYCIRICITSMHVILYLKRPWFVHILRL